MKGKATTARREELPQRGVVCGKFYPYHLGHRHLIATAAQGCQELDVLVCKQPGQWIGAELRASWIRESFPADEYPQIRIHVLDQEALGLPDGGSNGEIWARGTIDFLGYAPDVVFTSEDYGHGWARAMSAEHILVDRARDTVPISGTEIRRNPLANLEFLELPARAYFLNHCRHGLT